MKSTISRKEQAIELHTINKSNGDYIGQVNTFFDDLDEARIYAMARPAFCFCIEMYDTADNNGARKLLCCEYIN